MKSPNLLRVFRANWLMIALTVVVAVAVGVAVSLTSPRQYHATTELYVAANNQTSGMDAYQGVLLSQQQVASYALLISSPETAARALRSIGSNADPADLASRIKATYVPDTVVINVTVTDPDAARSAQLVNAVSRQFVEFVNELNEASDSKIASARVSLVRPADQPSAPDSRNTARNAAIGLIIGLALAFSVAYIRESLRNEDKVRKAPAKKETAGPDPTGDTAGSAPIDAETELDGATT